MMNDPGFDLADLLKQSASDSRPEFSEDRHARLLAAVFEQSEQPSAGEQSRRHGTDSPQTSRRVYSSGQSVSGQSVEPVNRTVKATARHDQPGKVRNVFILASAAGSLIAAGLLMSSLPSDGYSPGKSGPAVRQTNYPSKEPSRDLPVSIADWDSLLERSLTDRFQRVMAEHEETFRHDFRLATATVTDRWPFVVLHNGSEASD